MALFCVVQSDVVCVHAVGLDSLYGVAGPESLYHTFAGFVYDGSDYNLHFVCSGGIQCFDPDSVGASNLL